MPPLRPLALLAALFSLGCGPRARAPSTAGGAAASLPASGAAPASGARSDSLPAGPLGSAVRRGRALLLATRDSLPAHVGNQLRCVSCHLEEGRRPTGSWVGVYARYPQYRARSATVETIEYRINDCFRRSLNGRALSVDGADMRDIVAYLWFLSRDVPIGPAPPATRLARWGALSADTTRGRAVFETACAKCHGPLGQGTVAAPPVWGPASFTIGAGMARLRTAAAFIRDNMPFDQPGTLTDQQAIDVAAYVSAQRRPDFAAKIYDWPNGDAPPDVAYPTRAASRRPR